MAVTELKIAELTAGTLDGVGVFDVMMRASKVHLDDQFNAGRIRGPEYAEVYLGQMQAAMQAALAFLQTQKRLPLEMELLALQVKLAEIELTKGGIAIQLANAELLTAAVQRTLVEAQVDKVRADIELTLLQKENLSAEKQLIEANAQKARAEVVNIPKQGLLLDAQLITATQQGINAEVENRVLEAQVCKLQAEFDLTKQTVLKTGVETTLMTQKVATEKAQIFASGVEENSVIGRQKSLYLAQTDGFKRDAEQKAARLYVDVWSARKLSDEGTQANATNKLDEVTTGAVMGKLLQGIGA